MTQEQIKRIEKLTNFNLNSLNKVEATFIDTEQKIIRKGAIDSSKGKLVAIPINMRDGVIIAKGLGNPEANYSAPHGAGRLMSRTQAKANISLDEFKKSMEGITSWTVNSSTLDEAPQAYKGIEEILEGIKELVEVVDIVKPIFNFKADDGARE